MGISGLDFSCCFPAGQPCTPVRLWRSSPGSWLSLWELSSSFLRLQSQGTERMWEGQLPALGVLAAVPGQEPTPTAAIGPSASSGQSGERCLLPGGWSIPSPRLPGGGHAHQRRGPSWPAPHGAALSLCCGPPYTAAAASLILSAASLAGRPSLLPRASALPSALLLLEERAGTLALALPPSCLLECSVWWPQAAWCWLRQWGTGHTSGMPAPRGQAPLASPRLHLQDTGQHWAWSRAQGTWVNR